MAFDDPIVWVLLLIFVPIIVVLVIRRRTHGTQSGASAAGVVLLLLGFALFFFVGLFALLFIVVALTLLAVGARRNSAKGQVPSSAGVPTPQPSAPPQVQRETMIIEREIVKIPCKYCRSLIDPARDKRCQSCGAPVSL